MKANDARWLARELMCEHGLMQQGWSFEFDRAKLRFGRCKHTSKAISLSIVLTEANSEALVRDTILHEIAHALVGRGHGHDHVWRRQCRLIGANPERCYDAMQVQQAPRPYVGVCVSCGRTVERYRRRKVACGECCKRYNGGMFTERYLLDWRVA